MPGAESSEPSTTPAASIIEPHPASGAIPKTANFLKKREERPPPTPFKKQVFSS